MAEQLIEIDEALRIVLRHALPLASEPVELAAALGRVLAQDVASSGPVPPFTGSAMDGYAIRASEVRGAPVKLRLVGESRAGHPSPRALESGQAIAISTGAMMPSGADAVIQVEETRQEDGWVEIFREVEPGRYVRPAGADIGPGKTVLVRGARLGAAGLGVLASVGCAAPVCTRRPRVSILTTGDELVAPEQALRPGTVHNSGAYSIPALARRAGAEVVIPPGTEVVNPSVPHTQNPRAPASAPDDPETIGAAIAATLQADVAVICGGVSVGVHDHVKSALADLRVQAGFSGIALRPGKPTWFGTTPKTLVFALPGNPVSAMVTFILLVGPALRALSGERKKDVRMTARLTDDYEKTPGRAHAVRCRLTLDENGWHAKPTGAQDSHLLTSMLQADALAIIASASGSLSAGEQVEIEPLEQWTGDR